MTSRLTSCGGSQHASLYLRLMEIDTPAETRKLAIMNTYYYNKSDAL